MTDVRFPPANISCPHPTTSWFYDPRSNPPPLRARKTILAEIFREHTTFNGHVRSVLDNYRHVDDPDLLNREQAAEPLGPTFQLFPQLPLEIREAIWDHAIPSRIVDLREVRHDKRYICIRSAVLPIPAIAFTCREAYAVVMRLVTYLELAWLSNNRLRKSPIGFFIKGKDIPLFLPDPTNAPEPQRQSYPRKCLRAADGAPVIQVTMSTLIPAMACSMAVVNWAPPMRRPNMRDYPGSTMPQPWVAIKKAYGALGKDLRVVYIYYRSRYIEVSLAVPPEFYRHRKPSEPSTQIRIAYGYDVEVQLLVDLYDDQRLAELSSLETVLEDRARSGPRSSNLAARNPGLCLDTCERANWKKNIEPAVHCQWLQLFEDELDDDTYRAVFPQDSQLGYNPNHPWVKEKLGSAPEFRPAVLVHLSTALPADRDAAEYTERVMAIR